MDEALPPPVDRKQNRGFILGSLSFGHGIAHLYDQGIPVFMPAIASALGLSTLQVASLLAIRQAGFGVVNLGVGVFVDMLKNQWGLILTACMFWAAIAYLAVGAAPNFPLLVVAIAVVSIPGALWHLPATAALSRRFPDRRGFAVSIHGFGSNIGNVLGPILAGALLTILFYRNVLFIYAAPAAVTGFFVWWSLRDLGKEEGQTERRTMRSQFVATKEVLKNPVILALVLSAALRGVGLNALFHWTPFYLEEELGKSHFSTGAYIALLTGTGIISAPFLGQLSDRFGRKQVIIPGMAAATILSMLVVSAGDTFLLAIVFAGLGLFNFSLQQIILAAVLDIAGRGTEAATTGFIFGLNGIIGGASPFVATLIIEHWGGFGSIYYYAGILTALSGLIVLVIPLAKPQRARSRAR